MANSYSGVYFLLQTCLKNVASSSAEALTYLTGNPFPIWNNLAEAYYLSGPVVWPLDLSHTADRPAGHTSRRMYCMFMSTLERPN